MRQDVGITIEGIALADQAATDQDPIRTVLEGLLDQIGTDRFSTDHPDTGEIGRNFTMRLFEMGETSAPAFLAKKARDGRFERFPVK
jgi:hypothetical protein